MQSKLERIEKESSRLKKENEELEDQIKQQRELLADVDRERDDFQAQMDQKDIQLNELQGNTQSTIQSRFHCSCHPRQELF
jgi:septal ring factor EnvC (AmiA/AmiB activator)